MVSIKSDIHTRLPLPPPSLPPSLPASLARVPFDQIKRFHRVLGETTLRVHTLGLEEDEEEKQGEDEAKGEQHGRR